MFTNSLVGWWCWLRYSVFLPNQEVHLNLQPTWLHQMLLTTPSVPPGPPQRNRWRGSVWSTWVWLVNHNRCRIDIKSPWKHIVELSHWKCPLIGSDHSVNSHEPAVVLRSLWCRWDPYSPLPWTSRDLSTLFWKIVAQATQLPLRNVFVWGREPSCLTLSVSSYFQFHSETPEVFIWEDQKANSGATSNCYAGQQDPEGLRISDSNNISHNICLFFSPAPRWFSLGKMRYDLFMFMKLESKRTLNLGIWC